MADPDHTRALARARRAMDRALLSRLTDRTMTTTTLVQAGRGVPHNPACEPRPGAIRWSDTATAELDRLDGPARPQRLTTDDTPD